LTTAPAIGSPALFFTSAVTVSGAEALTEAPERLSVTVLALVVVVVVVVEPVPVVVQEVLKTLHPASLPPPPQAVSATASTTAPIRFNILVICMGFL